MNALLVVILVAAGEASHPATRGVVGAAREAYGPGFEVEVRETEVVPSDERALAVGTALHAAAVVELSWDAPVHRQATIRFHLQSRPAFGDRVILFDETDDVGERGRTVGYAIASMMTAPSEPDRPPAATRPRADSISAPARPPVHSVPSTTSWTHGAIDAVAAGATGVAGSAAGWGGSLSGRWYLLAPLALRIGASARAGQVIPAQSTSLLMHAAAGVAWVPLRATRASPFDVGVRIDALLMREQLTHFSDDDPEPVPAARWLPGADAALEAVWLFSPNAGFLGCFGAEVAFGRTDVTLHQVRVTSIPPLRLVFQAGVRAAF
jgi:hypothetical protein